MHKDPTKFFFAIKELVASSGKTAMWFVWAQGSSLWYEVVKLLSVSFYMLFFLGLSFFSIFNTCSGAINCNKEWLKWATLIYVSLLSTDFEKFRKCDWFRTSTGLRTGDFNTISVVRPSITVKARFQGPGAITPETDRSRKRNGWKKDRHSKKQEKKVGKKMHSMKLVIPLHS